VGKHFTDGDWQTSRHRDPRCVLRKRGQVSRGRYVPDPVATTRMGGGRRAEKGGNRCRARRRCDLETGIGVPSFVELLGYPFSMGPPSYSDLVYARGFLLSKGPQDTPRNGWQQVAFFDWVLSHHPALPVTTCVEGDAGVILIGNAVEPGQAHSPGNHTIALQILEAARSSREMYQHKLDSLIGRFVVITKIADAFTIQQDATSLKAVYYTDNQYDCVVGSHVLLVAENVGARRNYFGNPHYLKDNRTKVHPGVLTSYLGVNRLTPNTELNLMTRGVERVWPLKPMKPVTVHEAALTVIRTVDAQLAAFKERGTPLMCSLSAGLDSRVSLALLRPYVDNVLFFTYEVGYMSPNKANRWDREGALELVRKHGLKHRLLHLPEQVTDKAFLNMMRRNSTQTHQRTLAKAYLDELPADHLHIRSNVYEVGRNYYRHAGFTMDHLDGEGMLDVVSNNRSKDLPSIDAFEHYRNLTNFDSALELGYDALDLFYWENRMGVWMAPILHESDVAHDTHILLNSRQVLETLLGVDSEDREANMVFLEIIKIRWPELFEVPVNGVAYSPE
jgi:hypothetical protein